MAMRKLKDQRNEERDENDETESEKVVERRQRSNVH